VTPTQQGRAIKGGAELFAERPERGAVGALHDEAAAVPESPKHKVAGGAVPEATEGEGEDEVEKAANGAVAVSAEGNVDVVSNPRTQRDVPAGPEIAEAGGRVGIVEILRQAQAEHLREPQGDVGVTAEIEENARGERGEKEPGLRRAQGGEIFS